MSYSLYDTIFINNGNVGIGTTNPTYTLNVKGSIDITDSSDNSVFHINSSGNIGIGTTNPIATLQVEGNIKTTNNSINYNTSVGISTNVTSGTVSIAESIITTYGKPVFIICTGDLQPNNGTSSSAAWCDLQIYRDTTPIGEKITIHPGTATGTNKSFAIHTIDTPTNGTYTYKLNAILGSGQIEFGERGKASLSVIEFM